MDAGDRVALLRVWDDQTREHDSFAALSDLYHEAIRRELLLYYLAVGVLFLGLIVVDLFIQKIIATAGQNHHPG